MVEDAQRLNGIGHRHPVISDHQQVLAILRVGRAVCEEGTVARVGGDEFMISLWQVANAIADAVSRRVVIAMTGLNRWPLLPYMAYQ